MQVYLTLFAIAAITIVSIESKPAWLSPYLSSYSYPSETLAVDSPLFQYQDSPYNFYNVHTDVDTIPTSVLTEDKNLFHELPNYSFYYRTPVYNFPLSPVFPVLKPGGPQEKPKETTPKTTTAKPIEGGEEAIEKLDTKIKPEKEATKPTETMDSDNKDADIVDSI